MAIPAMAAAATALPMQSATTAALPGIASAGGSILGGVISNLFNRRSQKDAEGFQREAMQNAIQWKVADAKAAGIHPLYALGAQTNMPSPMVLGDNLGPALADAGQSIGNALARSASVEERAKQAYEIDLIRSQRDLNDAQRAYWNNEANRVAQGGNTGGLGQQMETNPMGQTPNVPGVGAIDLKPSEVISHKQDAPHVSAGMNPAYEERWLAEGFPIMLPVAQGESPEEIISEMSFPAWSGLLMRNARQYGEGWMNDLVNLRYFGKRPSKRYKSINESEGRGKPK